MNRKKISKSSIYHFASYEVLYTFQQDRLIALSAETVKTVDAELRDIYSMLDWNMTDTIETLKLVIEQLCYDGTIISTHLQANAQLDSIDIVVEYYNKYLDGLLKNTLVSQ